MRRGDLLLLENGTVHTCAAGRPQARWVLVDSGRIREVGLGEPPAAPGMRRFDLRGRTLVPAFTDAHVHLTWMATALLGPDLLQAASAADVLEAVQTWEGEGRGDVGAWIVGDGIDESLWQEKSLPTRDALDAVESARPVLVRRVCGHVGVVNSRALERLPSGPHTDRPSGRIAEGDLWALNERLRPGPERLAIILPQVVAALHAEGIAAAHDVTSAEMLRALQMLRERDALRLRVSCSLPTERLEALVACGVQCGLGDEFLRILGIKVFVDGSLGARTAFLRSPYTDDATTSGVALQRREDLEALMARADAAGLQLMIHAIGDAALELVLDCVPAHLARQNPLRHRLEHVEVTPADLVRRLAASGLHACVQPNFAGRWSQPGGMNEQRLGARLAHCNAYASLRDAGVPLSFGSDCMPLGALGGLRAAVEHPDPAQRLAPAVALELYTAAAAAVVHSGGVHGRLQAGFAADMALLSDDPLRPDGLAAARVEATFVAGDLVYERG